MKALAISDKRGYARFETVQAYYSIAGRELEREILPLVRGSGPRRHGVEPARRRLPVRQIHARQAGRQRCAPAEFEDYYAWLRPVAAWIDMWMTTYVLICFTGRKRLPYWFAGSALQPFLELLPTTERCAFLARYRDGLRDAYLAQPDGKSRRPIRVCSIVAVRG